MSTPTCYEPQDSNLPPGTQAGVTVHWSGHNDSLQTCLSVSPTNDLLKDSVSTKK